VAGAIRFHTFGQAAPLAVFAKPSDAAHGVRYALGALLGTGALPLVSALGGYRRLDGQARAIALALAAHLVALVLAGGDWMALYRLMVPVLPGAIVVCAALTATTSAVSSVLRVAVSAACAVVVWAALGARAAQVGEHRRLLIARSAPVFTGTTRVAALDIGWVGAATDAEIVDLAGITDPAVARLAGGHTSKRLPPDFLARRAPQVLVLLLADGAELREPWWTSRFARQVEQRVASLGQEAEVRWVTRVPLGGTTQSYVLVRGSF
jgi:hypothetical protein